VWEEALAAPPWPHEPVWVHGDLEGNCVVRNGRLSALIVERSWHKLHALGVTPLPAAPPHPTKG